MQPISKTFRLDGKDYTLEISAAAHRRVKDAVGISLADTVADVDPLDKETAKSKALDGFASLFADFDRFIRIVGTLLRPQLEKNNLTQEAFEELITGPVVVPIQHAFTQALIDFFHGQSRGKLLESATAGLRRTQEIQDEMNSKAAAAMDRKLKEIAANVKSKGDEAAEAMIRETLTNSSTTLPASLASILAPSP